MLSYTPDVLIALLAQYNASLWPVQLGAILAGLGILVLALRGGALPGRIVALLLAAAWFSTGAVFFRHTMAAIDFTAEVQGWIFIVQGLLFAWIGTVRSGLALETLYPGRRRLGLAIVVFSLVVYPVLFAALAGDWAAVPLFGLTPVPTLLVTLGLFMAVRRVPWAVTVIPLLWSLAAGWLAWALPWPLDLVVPAAGLALLHRMLLHGRGEPISGR